MGVTVCVSYFAGGQQVCVGMQPPDTSEKATQEVSLARPLHNATRSTATGSTCCDKQARAEVPATLISPLARSFRADIILSRVEGSITTKSNKSDAIMAVI